MRFKTDNEKREFQVLETNNPKLYKILGMLDQFCLLEFTKDICLTEVFRTQDEFNKLYAATPVAQLPKTSPHMTWEAVDIRSSDFTGAEKERIKGFLNSFSSGFSGKPVCLIHTIAANVEHVHLQIRRSV